MPYSIDTNTTTRRIQYGKYSDVFPPGLWSECPAEILLMVFQKLDGPALMHCSTVCMRWRDLIYSLVDKESHLQDFFLRRMVYSGNSLRNKSTMTNWRQLLFRNDLWQLPISHDDITLKHQYRCVNPITKMEVVKDVLVIQCGSWEGLYDLNTLKQLQDDAFQCETLGGNGQPLITLKLRITGEDAAICSVRSSCEHIQTYRFIAGIVLVVESGGSRKIYLIADTMPPDEGFHLFFLCSEYGQSAIVDAELYYGEFRYLTSHGKVYSGRRLLLEDNSQPTPPVNSKALRLVFDNFIVISVRGSGLPVLTKDIKLMYGLITCLGASCASGHNDLLLVGYEDGWVEIWRHKQIIKEGQLEEPALALHVCDFDPSIKEHRIVSLDVYEAVDARHLLVATENQVLQLVLDSATNCTSHEKKNCNRKRTYGKSPGCSVGERSC